MSLKLTLAVAGGAEHGQLALARLSAKYFCRPCGPIGGREEVCGLPRWPARPNGRPSIRVGYWETSQDRGRISSIDAPNPPLARRNPPCVQDKTQDPAQLPKTAFAFPDGGLRWRGIDDDSNNRDRGARRGGTS